MTDAAAMAKALIQRKGAVRSRELVEAGVARVQLSRMVAAGELIRLARGVYTAPGVALPGSEEGVLVVAERIPEASLCLLTALRLHGLTTQAPFEVWIAIGNKDRLPRLMVVSYRVAGRQPTFTVELSDWKLNGAVPASTFTAAIPKGATRVEFKLQGPAAAK